MSFRDVLTAVGRGIPMPASLAPWELQDEGARVLAESLEFFVDDLDLAWQAYLTQNLGGAVIGCPFACARVRGTRARRGSRGYQCGGESSRRSLLGHPIREVAREERFEIGAVEEAAALWTRQSPNSTRPDERNVPGNYSQLTDLL